MAQFLPFDRIKESSWLDLSDSGTNKKQQSTLVVNEFVTQVSTIELSADGDMKIYELRIVVGA
jgi:hypothetical protein